MVNLHHHQHHIQSCVEEIAMRYVMDNDVMMMIGRRCTQATLARARDCVGCDNGKRERTEGAAGTLLVRHPK